MPMTSFMRCSTVMTVRSWLSFWMRSIIWRASSGLSGWNSVAVGRRWLQEIVDGSAVGPDDIAQRDGCSKRYVMMMISLAFLAPDLVRAATQGCLPRSIGVTRLIDAPI